MEYWCEEGTEILIALYFRIFKYPVHAVARSRSVCFNRSWVLCEFCRVTLRNMLHPKLAEGEFASSLVDHHLRLAAAVGVLSPHFSVMPPGRPCKEQTPEEMRLVLEAQQLSARRYYEK